jgi:biopolymer transport protein ExbD
MSRRRKRRSAEEVELNLAAMLDMAFQLLTFFILTFRPAPVEGQINLRLPPAMAIAGTGTKDAGTDFNSTDIPKAVNTLVISAFSKPDGSVAQLAVGETPVAGLTGLDAKLRDVFRDKNNPFDQVIVNVGPDLRYEELMHVIEVCTQQTLPDGSKLSKLNFVEMPSGG